MLAVLEAKLEACWHDLDGQAREDLMEALDDAKDAEAQLLPLIAAFKAGLEAVVASAEPGLQKAAEDLVAKLLADVAGLLG
jgi:hypothetical protein